jgi:hypothetical protein
MVEYRKQKNITATEAQQKIIKDNFGILQYTEIAKLAGLSYNKTVNNMKLMGLIKKKEKAIVVKMEGYFDFEEHKKQYKY